MPRKVWLFLAVFFAGIGCMIAGVLLISNLAPGEVLAGAPLPEPEPLVVGLLIGGALLMIVGMKFGVAPLLFRLPGWLLLLLLIIPVGIALAYMIYRYGL
jgi:hypothetical protein